MDNKFIIWKGKYTTNWNVITPDARWIIEESFKDAIQRVDICILEYENA